MFAGSYMILGVNHTITPGSFNTSFEGVRQSIFSLPDIDSYIQGIITNLVETVFTQVKQNAVSAGGASSSPASQNTSQDKQNQETASKNMEPSNDSTCPINQKFQDEGFSPLTEQPRLITKSDKEVVDIISATTENITNIVIKTKLNYAIWCLMWLYTKSSTGFESYENNFGNLTLDLKISNQEKNYGSRINKLQKNYFCGTYGNKQSSFATFNSVEDFISFVSDYFKGRVDSEILSTNESIKNDKNKIKDYKEVSEDMYRFLYTNWPVDNNKNTYEKEVFPTQQTKTNIKDMENAIKELEILGL